MGDGKPGASLSNKAWGTMRVMLVSNRAQFVGGGEVSLMLLVEHLARSEEVEPIVASPEEGPVMERARSFGVETTLLPLPQLRFAPWRYVSARREAERVLGEWAPDLVHANGARAMMVAGQSAHRLGIPVLWHVRVQGRDPVDPWLARSADLVVAPSRTVASRFRVGAVRVVPNPFEMEAAPETAPVREHVGEILIAVGELTPRKGQEHLIRAMALLTRDRDARLRIVGTEDPARPGEQERLEGIAASLGVRERVEFLGYRDDVPALLRNSDLLVHGSETEGFGRVLVESLACGVPFVAAPAGGPREIHEATGLGALAGGFTPAAIAAAIVGMLDDAEARSAHRDAGPRTVREHYSAEVHARAIRAIYRELLDGSTP